MHLKYLAYDIYVPFGGFVSDTYLAGEVEVAVACVLAYMWKNVWSVCPCSMLLAV